MFNIQNCNPVKTSGVSEDKQLDDYQDSTIFPQKKYQEAIGSIMYLATGMNVDIFYTVSRLLQFSRDPQEVQWTANK